MCSFWGPLVCCSFRFEVRSNAKALPSENQIKKLLLQEVSEKFKEKLLPGGKVKRYLACPGVFRGLAARIVLFTENP
jgi:hypothetical protein